MHSSCNTGKNRSQLSVIFEVIGTPQVEDLPHLDENTAALLSNLPAKTPQVFYAATNLTTNINTDVS